MSKEQLFGSFTFPISGSALTDKEKDFVKSVADRATTPAGSRYLNQLRKKVNPGDNSQNN